jgi:hypothetical protein
LSHRDALDFILRGRAELLRPKGRESYDASEYQATLALNPNMVHALANLGRCQEKWMASVWHQRADRAHHELFRQIHRCASRRREI